MKYYLKDAKVLAQSFEEFPIKAIPGESNYEVDALNKYSLGAPPLKEVHFGK